MRPRKCTQCGVLIKYASAYGKTVYCVDCKKVANRLNWARANAKKRNAIKRNETKRFCKLCLVGFIPGGKNNKYCPHCSPIDQYAKSRILKRIKD